MSISDEKAYEHASDILHEQTYGQAIQSARDTVKRHRITAPHDVLAILAWEAYWDACEYFDVDPVRYHFAVEFPTLAEEL